MRLSLARLAAALGVGVGLSLGACSVPAVSFTFGGPDTSDAGTDTGSIDTISDVVTARLTVLRTGAAAGSVSADGAALVCTDSCTAVVALGTSVTLNAAADTGAVFGGWSGDACSSAGPRCTLSVTGDMTIDARFDVAMLTVGVTLAGSGGGSVASSPAGLLCPGSCSVSVAYGTELELVAAPSASATFLGWSGACSGTDRCRVTVTTDTTVSATFAADQELVVNRTGNGSGTVQSAPGGILCGATCMKQFAFGTLVTLAAAADSTSNFTGWSGACSGTGSCQVTMAGPVAVSAAFALKRFPLTVVPAGSGTGVVTSGPAGITCGTDCTELYDLGTIVTLTATPSSGSTFAGWSGACTGTGTCQVTIANTTSVTATFTTFSGLLVVASYNGHSISTFPNNASGNVAPIRTISGAATTLVNPRGVAVVGNEIIAMDQGATAVVVFDVNANGNVAPLRRIVGPTTGLNSPAGVLVFGGEIYVGQQNGVVAVFPLGANGDVAPTRAITGIGEAEDIAIVGGELYTPDAIGNRIVVFPASASGAATPSRVIAGPATGLATPVGLRIVNGEIVVGNAAGGAIVVFPQSASGNVTPLRTIAGSNTDLGQTLQITVFGGEIYVASFNSSAVDVFPLNASGNVSPARQIAGAATLILNPAGVCVF